MQPRADGSASAERLAVRRRRGRQRATGARAPLALPQAPDQRRSLDAARTKEELWQLIGRLLATVPPAECARYLHHCAYMVLRKVKMLLVLPWEDPKEYDDLLESLVLEHRQTDRPGTT
jgi:hypothetical protein